MRSTRCNIDNLLEKMEAVIRGIVLLEVSGEKLPVLVGNRWCARVQTNQYEEIFGLKVGRWGPHRRS